MTVLGGIVGTLMVLVAIVHQINPPTPTPRRRAGGIGHNRKARR